MKILHYLSITKKTCFNQLRLGVFYEEKSSHSLILEGINQLDNKLKEVLLSGNIYNLFKKGTYLNRNDNDIPFLFLSEEEKFEECFLFLDNRIDLADNGFRYYKNKFFNQTTGKIILKKEQMVPDFEFLFPYFKEAEIKINKKILSPKISLIDLTPFKDNNISEETLQREVLNITYGGFYKICRDYERIKNHSLIRKNFSELFNNLTNDYLEGQFTKDEFFCQLLIFSMVIKTFYDLFEISLQFNQLNQLKFYEIVDRENLKPEFKNLVKELLSYVQDEDFKNSFHFLILKKIFTMYQFSRFDRTNENFEDVHFKEFFKDQLLNLLDEVN